MHALDIMLLNSQNPVFCLRIYVLINSNIFYFEIVAFYNRGVIRMKSMKQEMKSKDTPAVEIQDHLEPEQQHFLSRYIPIIYLIVR